MRLGGLRSDALALEVCYIVIGDIDHEHFLCVFVLKKDVSEVAAMFP